VNADLSVAPEIAQLAAPLPTVASLQREVPASITTGQLATALLRLSAAPQRWWDLVRFNPDRPARITVPAPFEAWLLVIPPGQAAGCRCELATAVAGQATEDAWNAAGELSARRLRQGRVLVHAPRSGHSLAGGHSVRSAGHGYSVSLHAGRYAQPRPASAISSLMTLGEGVF
jgi:hypothetical protein